MALYGIKENKALEEITGGSGSSGAATIYDIVANAATVEGKYIKITIPRAAKASRVDVGIQSGTALTTYRILSDYDELGASTSANVICANKDKISKYIDISLYQKTNDNNDIEIYIQDNNTLYSSDINSWKNYNAIIIDNVVYTAGDVKNITVEAAAELAAGAAQLFPYDPYHGGVLFGWTGAQTINNSSPSVTFTKECNSVEEMTRLLNKARTVEVTINGSEVVKFNGYNFYQAGGRGYKYFYLSNESKDRRVSIQANSDTNILTCAYRMLSSKSSDTEQVNEIVILT